VEKKLLESLTDDNYFNGDQIQMKLQKATLPPQKIVALFTAERQFKRALLQRLADRNFRDRHGRK
jgi:hypothetical protein